MRLLPLLLLAACWRSAPPEVRFVYVRESREPDVCHRLGALVPNVPEYPDFGSCMDGDDYWWCKSWKLDLYTWDLVAWIRTAVARCREDGTWP